MKIEEPHQARCSNKIWETEKYVYNDSRCSSLGENFLKAKVRGARVA